MAGDDYGAGDGRKCVRTAKGFGHPLKPVCVCPEGHCGVACTCGCHVSGKFCVRNRADGRRQCKITQTGPFWPASADGQLSFSAVTIALAQLGIASLFVTTTFNIILGGIVLALALAFGLGGKDAAARYLDELKKNCDQKQD